MSLIQELKRRNVFKVGAAYLALGWIVVQITGTIAPAMHLPDWTIMFVVWIGVIGFPFVVVFSWIFELTPEGLKLERDVDRGESITHVTSKRLDYIIIGMLGVAMLMFLADRFVPRSAAPAADGSAGAGSPATGASPGAADSSSHAGALPQQQAAPAALDEKSIAVLPFVNMSSDSEQDYFSDGISEELLNLLAKIPELKVTSRSSAFSYKGKEFKLAQVAQELHVAHVLEGSVRKSGSKVRITAQLIDTRSDTHLWSETYDRTLDDIFVVQDEIAGAVVEQLKIKLLGKAPQAKAVKPEAYALYLQARQLHRQGTVEGYVQSIALAQQALVLEPDYAAAWNQLAATYTNQAALAQRPVDEAYALARQAVDEALASDPELATAYDRLGWIAMTYDRDLPAAARHYLHALALEPANTDIIAHASTLAGILDRQETSIALKQYVVARDPISVNWLNNLGNAYLFAARFDEAIASWRAALRLSPNAAGAHASIGSALLLKGDTQAALAEIDKEPDELNRLSTLPMVYHDMGRTAESDAALAELIAKFAQSSAYSIASVMAWRNDADRAFEWLDKAVALHDVQLGFVVSDPGLAKLHDDPRWLPFLRKLGRAPEQLAAIPFEVKLPN